MSFSASYDLTTKIISAVVCALLLTFSVVLQQAMIGLIAVVIVVLAYAYSPRGYSVTENAVIVSRLIGNVRLPLEDVREVRRANRDDLCGAIRLWGNGGLFGYYGLFRTSNLGKCWWYLTNRGSVVVVVTAAKTALFSPDDADGFLAAVRASSPSMPSIGPAPELSAGRQRRLCSPAAWIGIGTAVLALVAVAFAVLYSPGPPAYTLTPDALTIHDRFYPVTIKAAGVDIGNIRVVDITAGTGWRPTARTNGFANAHYRSGWFRVANGQKVRLYRADGTRLVLLPPKGTGTAVLLEVEAPERFIAEVRREWSHIVESQKK